MAPSRQWWRASTSSGRSETSASREVPQRSKTDSKKGRSVSTVGPASTGPARLSTTRILPPGAGWRSNTVTSSPAWASVMAAHSPPTPAPTTTTCPTSISR